MHRKYHAPLTRTIRVYYQSKNCNNDRESHIAAHLFSAITVRDQTVRIWYRADA